MFFFGPGEYSVDIDMENAHPRLLLNLAKETSPETKLPFLERYCAHYKRWRQALAEYLGAPIKVAKIEITKIFYGSRPAAELPFLTQMA